MKSSVQVALIAQGLGIAYSVHKGELGQAFLLGGSMVATYLSTVEKDAQDAKSVLDGKKGVRTLRGNETLAEYVEDLKKAEGVAKA